MNILTQLLTLALATPLTSTAMSPEVKVATSRLSSDCVEMVSQARSSFGRGDVRIGGSFARLVLLANHVHLSSGDGHGLDSALRRSVRTWNAALGQEIFEVVSPDRSDFTVIAVDRLSAQDDEQGEVETRPEVSSDGTYHLTGTIVLSQLFEGRNLSTDEMSAVISHELGHILGLDDSSDGSGLMGLFDPEHLVIAPTAEEISVVSALRKSVSVLSLRNSR